MFMDIGKISCVENVTVVYGLTQRYPVFLCLVRLKESFGSMLLESANWKTGQKTMNDYRSSSLFIILCATLVGRARLFPFVPVVLRMLVPVDDSGWPTYPSLKLGCGDVSIPVDVRHMPFFPVLS